MPDTLSDNFTPDVLKHMKNYAQVFYDLYESGHIKVIDDLLNEMGATQILYDILNNLKWFHDIVKKTDGDAKETDGAAKEIFLHDLKLWISRYDNFRDFFLSYISKKEMLLSCDEFINNIKKELGINNVNMVK